MPETEILEQAENAHLIPIERRASVRLPSVRESTCQLLAAAQGMEWAGTVCNVSANGVAIRLERRFEIGTLLGIDVQNADETILVSLLARVARISLQRDSSWILGCVLTNPLR